MIESLKNDDVFLTLYDGEKGDSVEKELIVTGELAGVPLRENRHNQPLTRLLCRFKNYEVSKG